MRYVSKKGRAIDIPDSLTPQQVASIKRDADAGYVSRAQDTANRLASAAPAAKAGAGQAVAAAATDGGGLDARQQARLNFLLKHKPNDSQVKKLQALQKQGGGDPTGGGGLNNDVFNNDKTINTQKAIEQIGGAENTDFNKNWLASHPDETDQYGNTIHYTLDANGHVQRTITQGEQAKKFSQMALDAASNFHGDEDRQKAQDATYGTLTKYYDRDMARERETAQQELANRGIPFDPAAEQDPNTSNLYGKTLGAIGQKYQGLKDTASQQSILSGNQAYQTDVDARDKMFRDAAAGSALYGGNYGEYQNNVAQNLSDDDIAVLSMSADQYAKSRQMSLEDAIAKRDDATKRLGIATAASSSAAGNATSLQIAQLNAKTKLAASGDFAGGSEFAS